MYICIYLVYVYVCIYIHIYIYIYKYGCFSFLALFRMDPIRRLHISQYGPLGPSP